MDTQTDIMVGICIIIITINKKGNVVIPFFLIFSCKQKFYFYDNGNFSLKIQFASNEIFF